MSCTARSFFCQGREWAHWKVINDFSVSKTVLKKFQRSKRSHDSQKDQRWHCITWCFCSDLSFVQMHPKMRLIWVPMISAYIEKSASPLRTTRRHVCVYAISILQEGVSAISILEADVYAISILEASFYAISILWAGLYAISIHTISTRQSSPRVKSTPSDVPFAVSTIFPLHCCSLRRHTDNEWQQEIDHNIG